MAIGGRGRADVAERLDPAAVPSGGVTASAETRSTVSAASKGKALKRQTLDETTSAITIAEYLVLTDVKPSEIKKLEVGRGGLSRRAIALTFRVSEVLGIPDAFVMAPRYRSAFEELRAMRKLVLDACRETETEAA